MNEQGIGEVAWPAGRERTLSFARRLAASPSGLSTMQASLSAQRKMQGGLAPDPFPGDVLVACGLAVAQQGYMFATPALHAAIDLLAPEPETTPEPEPVPIEAAR